MSVINSETRAAWHILANEASAQRPSEGKRVRIVGGRKHQGREGVVRVHMESKYENAFRYASDAQAHLREMTGRYGFVVLVQPDDGSAAFWVKADYTEVLP